MNRLAHIQGVHHALCWWCSKNLGETFTSVESQHGTALRVHWQCRPEAERAIAYFIEARKAG